MQKFFSSSSGGPGGRTTFRMGGAGPGANGMQFMMGGFPGGGMGGGMEGFPMGGMPGGMGGFPMGGMGGFPGKGQRVGGGAAQPNR